MSINLHVNLSIAVGGAGTAQANFGTTMLVIEHAITANRQDGPYSNVAAVEAAGFTLAAAPAVHAWATRFFAQNPRASQIMIGRRLASENLAVALAAIEAVDPASWYCTNIALRTADEIMALATWTEARSKIAIAQSSSAAMLAGTASTAQTTQAVFGGTATDGTYSLIVTDNWTGAVLGQADVLRSTTPATNDDLATAMRAAWDAVPALAAISAPAGGTGANVDITFDGLGNGYTVTSVAPAPGTLVATDTPGTQNPGELTSDAAFDRTAVIYHDDDTEYLDAAITSRCLGFALEQPAGAGSWAYQRLKGITATRLTDPQKTALLADNVNYYSPVRYTSGVEESGFTFKGTMSSGRSIDVTTTVDLTQARLEEAALGVNLAAAASTRPKVPGTDAGIARYQTAFMEVFGRLVKAGHYAAGAISAVTDRATPWVDVPRASDRSAADKTARRLTGVTAEAIIAGAIDSVGDATVVGFTIDLEQ